MGFAFAAAMDSDKRLLPQMALYDVTEIIGEDGQLAERITVTKTIIPLMHPCLILCVWRVCEQAVVRGGDEGGD
jgi:hypothetical protein